MRKSRNRLLRQRILLVFLSFVFLISVSMIFLGATVFRSHLPFFQLIDGSSAPETQLGPEPEPNPGVVDFESDSGVRLYIVLGSDYRPDAGYRTDVILLVAMDRKSGKISMVSFPRDLWVSIPGYGEQRINTVMQLGGFPLLAETMQINFGVYPTRYAMIDMEGFLDVVDALGGIEFETEHYTADACDGSLDPDGWCEVGPGQVSLDSNWALWYVRARYNSSDFDRMRRTQEVVEAIAKKAISPAGLIKTPRLMSIYESEVESNIPADQMLSLARLGMRLDSAEGVRRFTIGQSEVTGWTTAAGAAVLLPNTPAIQAILQEALTFK